MQQSRVMIGGAKDEPRTQIKKFGTIVSELDRLAAWLAAEGCTHAVMESTGSYWKPVFNLLEAHVRVILANAADVQTRRGHKTDPNDSRWLAHLLRHGMIRPSFIPPLAIRELRDLTRRRRQLIGENSRERNRVQKILEDANVKLGDVLSDVFCVSGRLMLQALLDGHLSAEQIAELAKKKGQNEDPADRGIDRRPSTHRSSALPDPPCPPASAVPGSGGGGAQPGDPPPDGRPNSGGSVSAAAEHPRYQGRICCKHPGRGRRGHAAVPKRRAAQLLG